MLKNYLRIAMKVYWRRKMFTAINLSCIVLTLMVLLVVTAILETTLYPSGVEHRSDRFLHIDYFTKYGSDNDEWSNGLGYKLIDQYIRPMKTAERVAAVTSAHAVAVYQNDSVEQLSIRYADAEYWNILDFKILAGRVFTLEDVEQGHFVVVINASTAKKLFKDGMALGKKINIRSHQYEVIGVVEDGFHSYSSGDLWVASSTIPSSDYRNQLMGDFSVLMMAKETSGVAAMKKEIRDIAKTIRQDDPAKWHTTKMNADSTLDSYARGFASDSQAEESGASEMLMWIAVLMFGFMLLPALNLVNLNMGRMMERSSEIGVRKAFGASRLSLVWQFLVENVILSLFGCVIALIFTQIFLIWLCQTNVIPHLKVEVNSTVLIYGIVITIIFGLVSGVLPAWRMSKLDPVFALKGNA